MIIFYSSQEGAGFLPQKMQELIGPNNVLLVLEDPEGRTLSSAVGTYYDVWNLYDCQSQRTDAGFQIYISYPDAIDLVKRRLFPNLLGHENRSNV